MATELNTDDGRCLVMEWKSTVIEIPRSQYRQAYCRGKLVKTAARATNDLSL